MIPLQNRCMCVVLVVLLFTLSGCGALTGLPGHGGGKRFAVEQELVAAATRGAIKQIDLSIIRGKKVNLFVNAIGDTGAGNLVGGRFSVVSQLRGDYIQSPPTIESSIFPHYTTTTSSKSNSATNESSNTNTTSGNTNGTSSTSGSSSNSSNGVSTTDSVLAYPERKTTKQEGSGGVAQTGVEYKGLGAYQGSEEIIANDLQYLSALLQTYLFLEGVYVVPPSEAEIDVYVTVDVFGTVRTRVDWFLANNEILKAKTTFEVLAIDHLSGRLVMSPQTAGAKAEYNEQYILWAGPVSIKKTLDISEPLLCDFTDIRKNGGTIQPTEQDVSIPYPFRHQLENRKHSR
jgi:hypothetical protein